MLERNVLLALTLLAALSCGEDPPPAEAEVEVETMPITDLSTGALCPEDSALTWESFGREFMTNYCLRCHTSAQQGADRRAPLGADFDFLERVRNYAHQIDRLAAVGPKAEHALMPPDEPFPPMKEREKLGLWLACGAPGKGTSKAYSLQLGAAGSAAAP